MKFLLSILLLTSSCSTLAPILGGAAGAAAGSLGGPATAALGGGTGVVVGQMVYPNKEEPVSDVVALAAAQAGIPVPGTTASTLHEVHELVTGLGWWYLCLFILIPLITKKGRTWVRKFTDIHNSVSQEEINVRDKEQEDRLKKIEEMLEKKE